MADGQTLTIVKSEPLPPLTVVKSEPVETTTAEKTTQSDAGGIIAGAATKLSPLAERAVMEFATSPTAAKTAGALANAGTTLAGVAHGVATGNIPEIIASPIAGWQAGKGGYWLGKRLQSVAAPVATALEKVAPYASALSGAQGGLDLAQMDDPKRQDIGVLGIGTRGTAADQAAVMTAQIKGLVKQGIPLGTATKTVYDAWAKQLQGPR